ncbi:MAG: hypothetical protein ACLQU3_19165 [Limisphaerales bacterium]
MKSNNRRSFLKRSAAATLSLPLVKRLEEYALAESDVSPVAASAVKSTSGGAAPAEGEAMPMGQIAGQPFSRLIMGGNLIAGWSHSRDLAYVSTLMRRYNTPAKIRETLELGESQGITAINSYVMDDNTQIFEHWKAGGKIKWFAQARMDESGGFSQIQKAVDQGATGIHLNGNACEDLLNQGAFEKIGESVRFIRAQKRIAGVSAHDLRVIIECEKAGVEVDFYQKTLHSLDYYTAPRPGETGALGPHDNSWCQDPQAVIDFMAQIKKPWIAFKILAAGAIPPRAAFPFAFNSGADFILVGMFDWQVVEDTKLAKRVINVVAGANFKRARPWC